MATWIKKNMNAFWADDSGATSIEYAMIASGVSVVIVGMLTAIGLAVSGMFSDAADGL